MHFDAVFNRQKTRTSLRSLGTRILQLSKSSWSDQGGREAIALLPPPPEYATD